MSLVLGIVTTASLVVFCPPFGLLKGVSIPGLVAATTFGMMHGAIAFAAGAWTGRLSVTIATTATVAVVGNLLNTAVSSESLHFLRIASPWHWYGAATCSRRGRIRAVFAQVFYGHFAVFPLLLLFSTILGFVLAGHPDLEQRVINSALADSPILGTQLRSQFIANPAPSIYLEAGTILIALGTPDELDAARRHVNPWQPSPEAPSTPGSNQFRALCRRSQCCRTDAMHH